MAYTITDAPEPDDTAMKADELLAKILGDPNTEQILVKALRDIVTEANRPLMAQIAAMHQRLDKVLVQAAPVRTVYGRRRDY